MRLCFHRDTNILIATWGGMGGRAETYVFFNYGMEIHNQKSDGR